MKSITAAIFTQDLLTSPVFWWNRRTPEELANPATPDFQELLAITQNAPKVLSLISTTIPTLHGWCSIEKACALAGLVLATKPKVIIEIGVWAGRSLLPMAWAVKENRQGLVIGIDPYDPQQSSKDEFGDHEKWWVAQDHKAIQRTFESFIKRFGLNDVVSLEVMPSDKFKPVPCELLHIDGSHTEQAVRDAERFGPMVPLGGIAVFDDIMWVGGSVLRAIDCLEAQGFVERFRFTEQNWCIMQRIK